MVDCLKGGVVLPFFLYTNVTTNSFVVHKIFIYICNMGIQNRLQMIMRMNNLNASQFADKIGVQRSSISHIISGRNKPSLDFIQKTLEHFPRVNADWLVTGKVRESSEQVATIDPIKMQEVKEEPQSEYKKSPEQTNSADVSLENSKEIAKIVWFYSDGTYKVYQNKE